MVSKSQFLGNLQHAVDGNYSLLCHLGIYMYLWCLVLQTIIQFLHGDEFHVRALVARTGAIAWRCGDEGLLGTCLLHLVEDTALCCHNEGI